MRTIGSQKRETVEEYGARVVLTWPDVDRGMIVTEDCEGKRELWARNDRYAGFVIEYGGTGYEFVRSL